MDSRLNKSKNGFAEAGKQNVYHCYLSPASRQMIPTSLEASRGQEIERDEERRRRKEITRSLSACSFPSLSVPFWEREGSVCSGALQFVGGFFFLFPHICVYLTIYMTA